LLLVGRGLPVTLFNLARRGCFSQRAQRITAHKRLLDLCDANVPDDTKISAAVELVDKV
jgi:hypothetical protein